MSADIAKAVRLDQKICATSKYGFENPSLTPYACSHLYSMTAGQEVIFLADPVGFGEETPFATQIGITVMDYSQGAWGPWSVRVKRVGPDNNYINDVSMSNMNNQYTNFYDLGYAHGQKLLVYLTVPASIGAAVRWGQ